MFKFVNPAVFQFKNVQSYSCNYLHFIIRKKKQKSPFMELFLTIRHFQKQNMMLLLRGYYRYGNDKIELISDQNLIRILH
mgnify:CR=1 FL=1